jgi:hypothetical protein
MQPLTGVIGPKSTINTGIKSMSKTKTKQQSSSNFFVSSAGKVHNEDCRHYRPEKGGWQKLESLQDAVSQGYQLCRLCCPSVEELTTEQVPVSSIPQIVTETNLTEVVPEKEETKALVSTPAEESSQPTQKKESQSSSKSTKKTKSTPPVESTKESEPTPPVESTKESEPTPPVESTKESESTPPVESTKESEPTPPVESTKESESTPPVESTKESESTPPVESTKESEPTPLVESTKESEPTPVATESSSQETSAQEKSKSEQKKDKKAKKKPKEEPEKKRYKILAGNGCHQAIAEVRGMLLKPAEEGGKFRLILTDGTELQASFRDARLKWIAYNKEEVMGVHWFRGYPKMKDDNLVCFQIIAWDGDMPSNPKGWETWEFTGLWTPQKNLTVQRSMTLKEIRKEAKETGFIKKFKYTFTNSYDFVASKKLWIGYVYKLICRREGTKLKIQVVIPVACPRIKPTPMGKPGGKPFQGKDDQGKPPFNKYKKPES